MPLHPSVPPVLELLNASIKDLPRTEIGDIAMMRESALALPVSTPTAVHRVEDRRIPGPAGEIPVRIYWPDAAGTPALVAFFHGGGFVMCSLETHDELCRALCRDTRAVVVSVDYRLAPEARYPAAADDCYVALAWCAAHAAELGADPARLAVAGDSAGGNLAAVTALRARDLGGPPLRHQALIYPATSCAFDTASYRDNAEGYFLTAEAMHWFWGHYLGDMARASEPYACPARASDLSGLPPATIVTAEYDPLRDEAEIYGRALAAAGVEVTVRRYDGMIHGFVSMADLFEDGRAAQLLVAERLRAALG
jgi:acetyl esterase